MAEEKNVSPILDDRPAEVDALGFAPYRDTLVFFYFNCDNTKRETFNGILGMTFAHVTKEQGLPDRIAPLEIDLKRV